MVCTRLLPVWSLPAAVAPLREFEKGFSRGAHGADRNGFDSKGLGNCRCERDVGGMNISSPSEANACFLAVTGLGSFEGVRF
jgi:hypothetical protein